MQNKASTIAITGATGFVGAHLVRHFSKKGYKVIAIGRQENPPSELLQYASWQQADITLDIPDIEADILIHAAGKSSDAGVLGTFIKTNVEGTKNVWNAAKLCRRFVFISSSSVYSYKQKNVSESEAIINSKLSNYGRSKLLAEKYLLTQNESNKLLIIRPRAIYGTHDRVLLPRILNLVKKNKVLLPGSLDILISMTHIDNLANGIEELLNYENSSGVYNISDSNPYNLKHVVSSLLNAIHNHQLEYKTIPMGILRFIARINDTLSIPSKITSQSLGYMTESLVLDTTRLQETIEYSNRTNFDFELPKMVEWVNSVGIENVIKAVPKLSWMD